MEAEDEHRRKVCAALLKQELADVRSVLAPEPVDNASETDSDKSLDELSRFLDVQRDTEADKALREWRGHVRDNAHLQPQSINSVGDAGPLRN